MKAVTHPLPEMVEYFQKENDYLGDLVNSASTVLDVGCGNGRTMKFLSTFVQEIVGIDYDPKMVATAKDNLAGLKNTALICGDFFKHDFNMKFDLVFASYNLLGSSEVNPNFRDMLLEKMVTLTKTGGHVVASVWSDAGIDFAKKYYTDIGINVLNIKDNNVTTNHGIFKRFTKNELYALAKKTNKTYSVKVITGIFYLLDVVV